MRTILPFPAMIVPHAKCRVGITLDPVKKEATYRDDWPRGEIDVIASEAAR